MEHKHYMSHFQTLGGNILIEPLEEFVPHLDKLVAKLNNAEYIIAAASSTSGNIVINVHPDLVGSSAYKEEEDTNVNGFERIVPAVTLDDIRRDRKTSGPYVIKIDTQGSEIGCAYGCRDSASRHGISDFGSLIF